MDRRVVIHTAVKWFRVRSFDVALSSLLNGNLSVGTTSAGTQIFCERIVLALVLHSDHSSGPEFQLISASNVITVRKSRKDCRHGAMATCLAMH